MSREQFNPAENVTGAGSNQGYAGASTGGFQVTGSYVEDNTKPVQYMCGDCDQKVSLKRGDPIRCKECGYRVLYKERTNR